MFWLRGSLELKTLVYRKVSLSQFLQIRLWPVWELRMHRKTKRNPRTYDVKKVTMTSKIWFHEWIVETAMLKTRNSAVISKTAFSLDFIYFLFCK